MRPGVVLLLIALVVGPGLAQAAAGADPIARALAGPGRLAEDLALDDQRKPGEVLAFFGVKPGMTVLDVFSGGGYYAGILSNLLGPSGKTISHSNEAYIPFSKKSLDQRYADGRPANVEPYMAEANDISLPPESVDVALMILMFHDIYFRPGPEEFAWPEIDPAKLLTNVLAALKPGGVLGIVDHAANPGAPPETGTTLHRIDPALVKSLALAAGFIFDGSSDALHNPDDDHLLKIFDKPIRRHTDRFIYRFRKPGP